MKDNSNPVPEKVDGKTDSTDSARNNKEENTHPKTRSRVLRREWKENSFCANLGGSLTRQIAYNRAGKPVEAIKKLHDSLMCRINFDDVLEALSVDLLVADYGCLSKAMRLEECFLDIPDWQLNPEKLSVLSRYVASVRRNLAQSLKLFRELEKDAAETEAFECEREEADAELPDNSSSEVSATQERSDEAKPQSKSANFTDEASSSEVPVSAPATEVGEAQSNANDNGAVDSAPPTTTDQGPEQPVAAESNAAAEAAENTGATSDADTPLAA